MTAPTPVTRPGIFTPAFPRACVNLDIMGPQGNVFVIMGAVQAALRSTQVSPEVNEAYTTFCKQHNYEHALRVTAATVTLSKKMQGQVRRFLTARGQEFFDAHPVVYDVAPREDV